MPKTYAVKPKPCAMLAVIAVALSGCAAKVPDSAAGVGFQDYTTYQAQREAALNGGGIVGAPVGTQPIGAAPAVPEGMVAVPQGGFSTERLGAAIDAAEGLPVAGVQTGAVIGADAPMATAIDPNVGAPLSAIELLATPAPGDLALAAAPAVLAPVTPPPTMPEGSTNIVQFALSTQHAVGTAMYKRSSLRISSPDAACGKFPSADMAQEAFLAAGGPEQDRKGLDADGDGYACSWNPAPFRAALN